MSYRDSRSPPPRGRSPSPGRYGSPRRRSPYRRSPSDRDRGYRGGRYSRSPPRYSRRRSPYGRRSPPRYRRRSPRILGNDHDRKDSSTLFVGNLPYQYREKEITDLFSKFGRVANVTVGFNKVTQESKGYAFVTFEDRRDAEEAFTRNQGYQVEGRKLRIDWDIGLEKKQAYRGKSPPKRRSKSPRHASRSPSPPRRRSGSPAKEGSPDKKRSRSPAGSPSDKKQRIED